MFTTPVFVVYRTSENYDSEENVCGNSFCLIGVFDDPQKAENAARRHEAEIETMTLNAEQYEWF